MSEAHAYNVQNLVSLVQIFFSCTLHQLCNLINRRNVVKKPSENFNVCDAFFRLTLQCHMAALKLFELDSRTSLPPPELQHEQVSKSSVQESNLILRKYSHALVDLQLHMNSSEALVVIDDKINAYAIELLTLGLLYVEFTDAIREADGNQIYNCWKFMFPLFRASGRTNYACGLGANKTPKAITRIGKCVGILTSAAKNYDEETEVNEVTTGHSLPQDQTDVVKELIAHSVFSPIPGRYHSSFPSLDCSLFSKVSYDQLIKWMQDHIPT